MSEKLGSTGKFPDGMLDEDDMGELKLSIGHDEERGVVFIDFGEDVRWIAFDPIQAVRLAEVLVNHAEHLSMTSAKRRLN